MSNLQDELKRHTHNSAKELLCREFMESATRPKYLFGRNVYAEKVVRYVDHIAGVIDDFATEMQYHGMPILKLENVPANALVLILSGGRPLSAEKRLQDAGLDYIDYFAFFKYSGLPLDQIRFAEGFHHDFGKNQSKYEWIKQKLADDVSIQQLQKLIDFKLSYELDCLKGFRQLEHLQYFEDFLGLDREGEVFADVGSFDGYTSEEFIKRCPGFSGVHVFEPIPENMDSVVERLSHFQNIHYHPFGLSDQKQTLQFSASGSCSTMSVNGEIPIEVDTLDNLVKHAFTFIKMDIEGAELAAIEGARKTISRDHPKLAISVYHRPSDLWAIPEKVLSIYDGYRIYLRHYTESVYETVMFFIP